MRVAVVVNAVAPSLPAATAVAAACSTGTGVGRSARTARTVVAGTERCTHSNRSTAPLVARALPTPYEHREDPRLRTATRARIGPPTLTKQFVAQLRRTVHASSTQTVGVLGWAAPCAQAEEPAASSAAEYAAAAAG